MTIVKISKKSKCCLYCHLIRSIHIKNYVNCKNCLQFELFIQQHIVAIVEQEKITFFLQRLQRKTTRNIKNTTMTPPTHRPTIKPTFEVLELSGSSRVMAAQILKSFQLCPRHHNIKEEVYKDKQQYRQNKLA